METHRGAANPLLQGRLKCGLTLCHGSHRLCLLHLSHLERGQAAATRAAPNVSAPDSAERHAQAQGEGSPPSSSSVAESVSRSDGAPHLRHSISALRGSAASGDAAGHLDLSTLNGTGSYVNIDGWQVGGPPTDGDEWQTVSSKRARKKRRQPDASQHSVAESSMSAAAETSAVASSSEVDASVNGFSRTRTLSEIEDRLSSSSSSQGESNPESKAAQRAALKEQRKKRKAAKKKGTVLEDSSQQAPAEKLQINEEAPSQRTQTHLDQSDSRDGTSSEADGAGDGAPAEASSTAVNGAQAEEKSYDTLPDDQKAHRDERQVDLDVNRSFVGYTSGRESGLGVSAMRIIF